MPTPTSRFSGLLVSPSVAARGPIRYSGTCRWEFRTAQTRNPPDPLQSPAGAPRLRLRVRAAMGTAGWDRGGQWTIMDCRDHALDAAE
jgi:hypothetical protein